MDGRWGALGLALLCAGCDTERLSALRGDFWTDRDAVAFEPTWVGQPRQAELRVFNTHRMGLRVTARVDPPFSVAEDELWLAPGGEGTLRVRFDAAMPGAAKARLTLRAEAMELRIPVHALAREAPACMASACTTAFFDPTIGACRAGPLPDGTACTAPCVEAGICHAGACVGAQKRCDDANACTADACDPATGCVHADISDQCAAPEDPCRAARCDPASGCVAENVPDGTLCGEATCGGQAKVCVAGTCVVRDNAAGRVCTTGCGLGVCQGAICVGDPSALDESCTLATREVYLHTSDALYVDPLDGSGPQRIGPLVSTTGEDVYLVDIAVHPDGRLYGISNGWLYLINAKTAECTRVGAERDAWAVAMTFLPDGRLVIAGTSVNVLDPESGKLVETLVPHGVFQSSGDILAVPDGALLWTVLNASSGDLLVEVHPGSKAVRVLGETGVSNIWGLAWARGEVLGYTATGLRVTLDRQTGTGSQSVDLGSPWYGATTHPWYW